MNSIAFSVVFNDEFTELLKALRLAFLNTGEMPKRKFLGGPLLDRLYTDIKANVDAFIAEFLTNSGKMTLVLDEWENICYDLVVNVVTVVGTAAVFIESQMVGEHEGRCAGGDC